MPLGIKKEREKKTTGRIRKEKDGRKSKLKYIGKMKSRKTSRRPKVEFLTTKDILHQGDTKEKGRIRNIEDAWPR